MHPIGSAFPGIHGLRWFTNSKEAGHRLEVLLTKPIQYEVVRSEPGMSGLVDIFWWYRDGSNLFIRDFEILHKNLCLLNSSVELNIDKIAVYRSYKNRYSFVYVETKTIKPTGFYDVSKAKERIEEAGYYEEPYGILGKRNISINDYEDRSTVINGKVISADEATFRLRHVSKYNFIIASQLSPYNSQYFDRFSGSYLNGVLNGKHSYDNLFNFMKSCREEHDNYSDRIDRYEDFLD